MTISKTRLVRASITTLSLLTALSLLSTPAFASEKHEITAVAGTIKDSSNNPVDHATVTVTCNGHTKTTHTNSIGFYGVAFHNHNCTDGDTLTVTADKAGVGSSSSTGTVGEHDNDQGRVDLDLSLVNFSIPEFSTLLGSTAFIGSLGSFLLLKKKSIIA